MNSIKKNRFPLGFPKLMALDQSKLSFKNVFLKQLSLY